jgi:hypothetical protein
MKLDTDPGRTREFAVLWLLILLVFAVASLVDLLRAPGCCAITDTPVAAETDAEDDGQAELVLEPWFASVPANAASQSPSTRDAVPPSPAGPHA